MTVGLGLAVGMVMLLARGHGAAKELAGCVASIGPSQGSIVLETRSFSSPDHVVQAAEHFVCHEIRQPGEAYGWRLQGIDAQRIITPGSYMWNARLRYTLGEYGTPSARYLVVMVQDRPIHDELDSAPSDAIWLGAQPAELLHTAYGDSGAVMRWRQDGLYFEAQLMAPQTTSAAKVSIDDLAELLATVN
ncbi:MAG TPA: hypothetical protein VH951_08045 [Dehalococcoidia bacterium]